MSTRLLYSRSKPGRLVPTITLRGRNLGFIPDPLPRELDLSAKLRAALDEARAAAAELDRFIVALESPADAVAFLRLREAIRSAAADRPPTKTFNLLAFRSDGDAKRGGMRAWKDILNYRRALCEAERAWPASAPLPLRDLIQRIHVDLFGHQPRRKSFAGRFRRGPIQMGAGERYVPPPYRHVVPLLHTLERQLRRPGGIDPVILCFMVHYQFESIHPFTDGNGRVGRILLGLMLNRALGLAHPAVYLSAAFCNYRGRYSDGLFRVNTHGDWTPWLAFCLEACAAQARDAALRLRIAQAWLAKCAAALPGHQRAAGRRLLDGLMTAPVLDPRAVERLRNEDGAVADAALRSLQSAGVLKRAHPGGRFPRWFAPALVQTLVMPIQRVAGRGGGAPASADRPSGRGRAGKRGFDRRKAAD